MYSAVGLCNDPVTWQRASFPASRHSLRGSAMPFVRAIAFLALPVVFAFTPVAAQEVITEKALSLDLAHAIAQGALEKCRADG